MAQGQRGANLLLSTAASKSHGASKADCITRPLFRKHRPFVLASSNRCTVSPYCDVAESGRVSALGAALSNVIGCIVFIRRVKSGMVCNISATGSGCVICVMDWMETRQDCHISLSKTKSRVSFFSWASSVYATAV